MFVLIKHSSYTKNKDIRRHKDDTGTLLGIKCLLHKELLTVGRFFASLNDKNGVGEFVFSGALLDELRQAVKCVSVVIYYYY